MSVKLKIKLRDDVAKNIEDLCARMKMDPAEFCLYLIVSGLENHLGITGPAILCSMEALENQFNNYQALQKRVKELEARQTGAKSCCSGDSCQIQQPM
jgi:hypothetical protein